MRGEHPNCMLIRYSIILRGFSAILILSKDETTVYSDYFVHEFPLAGAGCLHPVADG